MTHGTTASVSPWWGVPVIAGGFLILGGFLTFLFTRANEKKKYERERTDREIKEIVDQGAELLTAGNKMREIALLGLRGTVTEFARRLAKQGKPALDPFVLATNRFRLVVPLEMRELFEKYIAAVMVLFIPPFAAPGQQTAVELAAQRSNEMLDALRTLQGRKPFNITAGKMDVPERAAKSTAMLMEEMIQEAINEEQAKEEAETAAEVPPQTVEPTAETKEAP